jgi:aspartate racemase
MKILGMIGGIAPGSTIEYYRLIVAKYRDLRPDGSYPPIILNSIDLQKMLGFVERGELTGLVRYLGCELQRLAEAGADFGLLASNTPHIVFNELQRESPIPLLSIVQAACDAARELGIKRAALFGTRFTMQGDFYPEVFSRAGITLTAPSVAEQDYIHDRYMNELVRGVFLPETRERLLKITDVMMERDSIEGVVLGGTELPLLLQGSGHRGIPLLDTTKIHVERAVAKMLSQSDAQPQQ